MFRDYVPNTKHSPVLQFLKKKLPGKYILVISTGDTVRLETDIFLFYEQTSNQILSHYKSSIVLIYTDESHRNVLVILDMNDSDSELSQTIVSNMPVNRLRQSFNQFRPSMSLTGRVICVNFVPFLVIDE